MVAVIHHRQYADDNHKQFFDRIRLLGNSDQELTNQLKQDLKEKLPKAMNDDVKNSIAEILLNCRDGEIQSPTFSCPDADKIIGELNVYYSTKDGKGIDNIFREGDKQQILCEIRDGLNSESRRRLAALSQSPSACIIPFLGLLGLLALALTLLWFM